MARLTQQDMRAFLELLADLYALQPLAAFRTALLHALPRVVATELTSYHEMQPAQGTSTNWAVPSNVVPPALDQVWEQHMTEHPVLAYNVQTGDGRAMMVSDFLSRSQFHRLG